MFDSVPTIVLALACIVLGFIGLVWSADRFVAGAAAIAKSFGVAPLVIGLTIVSFGTSAPEVMVSLSATIKHAGELAIGNAIGSNIANIGLVLGLTLLIASIPVQKHILRHELPTLLFITALTGVFLYDRILARWEAIFFLVALIPVIIYLTRSKQSELTPSELAEEEAVADMPRPRAFFWFALGLAALIGSSELLVWGAKTTAEHYGVSPLIIGLTVIAIGTSLPELAASIMSALKGHHDIALGNIIGSNIFNLMAVLAIPGTMHALPLDPQIFNRDYLSMLGLTLILSGATAFALWRSSAAEAKLGRATGCILLICYIAYMSQFVIT